MKCDELKVYKVYTTRNEGAFGFCEGSDPTDIELEHESVCLKSDVDAAIAELKDVNHELQVDLEGAKATAYADSVDAGMRERRLQRALYKACANWALSTLAWLDCIDQGEPRKWSEMMQKCRAKAEEYR